MDNVMMVVHCIGSFCSIINPFLMCIAIVI